MYFTYSAKIRGEEAYNIIKSSSFSYHVMVIVTSFVLGKDMGGGERKCVVGKVEEGEIDETDLF